jgi:cysteine desulfurase family protein (TIGR01976 family)
MTDDLRARFPGLSDGWVRLDGPAGTLPVDTCVDAIADYMRSPSPANLGGEFEASKASDAVVELAREGVARLVNARPDEVVFGPSTTNLMFAFTRAVARHWQAGDRVVCTQLDHDSNVSPWLTAARDAGARVEMLPVDPVDGTLDVEPLKELCRDGRTRWVAITGASNLNGYAPDIARAAAIAHEHGARILVDGVARVPHLPTDVAAWDLDVLSTSPYKWYGPHAGALVVRNGLLGEVEPYRVRPADYVGPARWETGTAQIELLAGVAAAADFMLETRVADASERETRLLGLLQEGLHEVPGVTVHGPAVSQDRAPTVVFTVAGRTPQEVDAHLARRRIAVWHGDNYACELVDALGLREAGGLVRAGIVRYTTPEDIAALLAALTELSTEG